MRIENKEKCRPCATVMWWSGKRNLRRVCNNTWDYGPLGVEFKNNVKKHGGKNLCRSVLQWILDSAILMNPQTLGGIRPRRRIFRPAYGLQGLQNRHRADQLIEAQAKCFSKRLDEWRNGWFHRKERNKCPNCGSKNFTPIRKFNLMFKTFQGVTEDSKKWNLPLHPFQSGQTWLLCQTCRLALLVNSSPYRRRMDNARLGHW